MQTPIHAKYKFDASQFQRANRSFRKQQVNPKIRMLAIVVCLGAVAMGTSYAVDGDTRNALLFIGVPLYLWILLFIRRFAAKRRFNRSSGKDAEIEWVFSDEEILMHSSQGASTTFKWSLIDTVIEFSDGLLLSTYPQLFQWVPKEGIVAPNSFSELCTLARGKVKNFKKL